MENNEREQFVEDLLDASLARYSSVTPRPGLDGRILAKAKAAQRQRRWFLWAEWVAAGAVAALLVVGVFSFMRRPPVPAPLHAVEAVNGPATNAKGSPTVPVPPERGRAVRPQILRQTARTSRDLARHGKRPSLFPSPSPITEQERLLAQYVHATPPEALAATATDTTLIPELEIKPISIVPLDTEETEPKNN